MFSCERVLSNAWSCQAPPNHFWSFFASHGTANIFIFFEFETFGAPHISALTLLYVQTNSRPWQNIFLKRYTVIFLWRIEHAFLFIFIGCIRFSTGNTILWPWWPNIVRIGYAFSILLWSTASSFTTSAKRAIRSAKRWSFDLLWVPSLAPNLFTIQFPSSSRTRLIHPYLDV